MKTLTTNTGEGGIMSDLIKHLMKQYDEHVQRSAETIDRWHERFFANYYRGDINDVMLFRTRIHGGDKK